MLLKLLHATEYAFVFLPCSWVLYVNGKVRITDCPSVNDGNWHHIAVTWTCTDGAWKVYIDGKLSDGGSGLSVGSKIPGMLYLYYTRSVASILFLLQNLLCLQGNVYFAGFSTFSHFQHLCRAHVCYSCSWGQFPHSASLKTKCTFLGKLVSNLFWRWQSLVHKGACAELILEWLWENKFLTQQTSLTGISLTNVGSELIELAFFCYFQTSF